MKCPLFNSNAWIVTGSIEGVPSGAQRQEIKLEIKIADVGKGFMKAVAACARDVNVHKHVPVFVLVSMLCACVHVCMCALTCEYIRQRLSCPSWPGVGRCLWKASQKRKLSRKHFNNTLSFL